MPLFTFCTVSVYDKRTFGQGKITQQLTRMILWIANEYLIFRNSPAGLLLLWLAFWLIATPYSKSTCLARLRAFLQNLQDDTTRGLFIASKNWDWKQFVIWKLYEWELAGTTQFWHTSLDSKVSKHESCTGRKILAQIWRKASQKRS